MRQPIIFRSRPSIIDWAASLREFPPKADPNTFAGLISATAALVSAFIVHLGDSRGEPHKDIRHQGSQCPYSFFHTRPEGCPECCSYPL